MLFLPVNSIDTAPYRSQSEFTGAAKLFPSAADGVLTVNYLLIVGLALFSSASGALLVTLLHITRRDASRTPSHPETEGGAGRSRR
jgi:hypothetical protein